MIYYDKFRLFLYGMIIVAIVVFVALFFVEAGYGKFKTKKWGMAINNKLGWFMMEFPIFAYFRYTISIGRLFFHFD